jgi:ubiquinone/menaquinone biosynthesis C-methylase UbiE
MENKIHQMSNVKSYFDTHTHNHAYHNDPSIYNYVIDYIKKTYHNKKVTVLDIGCGDAPFIKNVIKNNINATCFATDISYSMIKMAKQNIPDDKASLLVSDGFHLPFKSDIEFDIVHLDSVLHHIIGKNRVDSKQLIKKLLEKIINILSKNGSLVIEEVYYNSYLFPSITSSMIFYGLKFLNYINLDISQLIKEFSIGLEVNFFYEEEIVNLMETYGNVKLIKRIPWDVPLMYKFLLLKKYGHISYIVNKL